MDNLFSKSVIFICEHNSNGAVGLIINKRLDAVLSSQIYGDLNKKVDGNLDQSSPLYIGGPVSLERGIMLHDKKILLNSSIEVSKNLFTDATGIKTVNIYHLSMINYKTFNLCLNKIVRNNF